MPTSYYAIVLSTLLLAGVTQVVRGATFTEYTDKSQWQADVGQWTTIGFADLTWGDVVTTQYSDLGVTFTEGDDSVDVTTSYLEDGYGLQGSSVLNPNDSITVEFDGPMFSIAADYPGILQIEFYSLGRLMHTTKMYGGGEGNFLGVISTSSFDSARVIDPSGFVFIDDLHFGDVPGPATLPILALALLRHHRRRV